MTRLFYKAMLLVSFLLSASLVSHAFTISGPPPEDKLPAHELAAIKSNYQGDVFLLRGFADIFSRGLDDIGARLKAKGIDAEVIGHTSWRYVARTIIDNQKKYGGVPVILIGHSLGANAVIRIAKQLNEHKIKVQYLVTFEPTQTLEIPSNVDIAINYYLSNSTMGVPLTKAQGSSGTFENRNMVDIEGIGHFNIEKQPMLQQTVIDRVLKYVKPVNVKKSAQLLK